MRGALSLQLVVLLQKSTECLVSCDAAEAKGEQAGGAGPRAEVRPHASSSALWHPSEPVCVNKPLALGLFGSSEGRAFRGSL